MPYRPAHTSLALLFLTIVAPLYLAAMLGMVLNPWSALAVACATVLVAFLFSHLRKETLCPSELFAMALGLILVVQTRPRELDSIAWDVASYGLMKYPEMKTGVVGPYFSYGHVYEFLVSYMNELFPPLQGLSFLHSLSLFFLVVFALDYANATRSRLSVVVCVLLLLLRDPTHMIAPELRYTAAGKSDVLLAAVILEVWALLLKRRSSGSQALRILQFIVTNSLAAFAVGMKSSAAIALGLPMLMYWKEFIAQTVGRLSPSFYALAFSAVAWLFFCWQYLSNILIFGSPTDRALTVAGMSNSFFAVVGFSLGALAHSSPQVAVVALALTLLLVIGLTQRAGSAVLNVRCSALLLLLLCPWLFNGSLQRPQFRLVLPALFLVGIDAAAVVSSFFMRLKRRLLVKRPTAERAFSTAARQVKVSLPVALCAAWSLLALVILSPQTRANYEAYFYEDYRAVYLYFTEMSPQTIYAYGLRPYFLLGRRMQHRVVYDLHPPGHLRVDPAAFAQYVAACVSPNFLVFSDHVLGSDYFRKLLLGVEDLQVVAATEHFIVLRNAAFGQRKVAGRCPARYPMTG